MTPRKLPNLLTFSRLAAPSAQTIARLEAIQQRLSHTNDEITLQGFFALAVASFETMLADTYRTFLQSVPAAVDLREIKVSKAALLASASTVTLLDDWIEQRVRSEAYKKLADFLLSTLEALAIATPPFDEELTGSLIEIKETRNLLLHNNLRVSATYRENSGKWRRDRSSRTRLDVNQEYVQQSVMHLLTVSNEIQGRLQSKYAAYTKLRALRSVWSFMFRSSVMSFENFWVVDEEADAVLGIRLGEEAVRLATSEEILLGLWRAQFGAADGYCETLRMGSLDSENRQKVLLFLGWLDRISLQ